MANRLAAFHLRTRAGACGLPIAHRAGADAVTIAASAIIYRGHGIASIFRAGGIAYGIGLADEPGI